MPPGELGAVAATNSIYFLRLFSPSCPHLIPLAYVCLDLFHVPAGIYPLCDTVDKLTQTMPSPHFHKDYRHFLQINKQNHAMQLMFHFFKHCISTEEDCNENYK